MANTIKGILGHKLGMTQVFDEANRVVPVTVVAAGPVVVTAVRTPETDGYSARAVRVRRRSTRARSPSRSPATSPRPASRRAGTSPSCAPTTSPATRSARN